MFPPGGVQREKSLFRINAKSVQVHFCLFWCSEFKDRSHIFFAKDQGSTLDQGSWEWVDRYVPSNFAKLEGVKEHPLWDAIARGKTFLF